MSGKSSHAGKTADTGGNEVEPTGVSDVPVAIDDANPP